MTENDCLKPWTNRVPVLYVMHGLPGDDIFLSRPKMTPFSPRMRWNRGGGNWESWKRLFPGKFGVPGEETRITIAIYAVSPVSVSAATRWTYYVTYFDTYVRWSHVSILVWGAVYDFFQLWCVRVLSLFFCFSSWGNLPLQSCWSLSCDHGLHCL